MKNRLVNLGLLTAACLAILPATAKTANAQELTLKLEPGLAIPLTHPQDHEFKPGFDGEAKLLLGLGPYASLGPSFGVLALPTNVSTHDTGTAEFVGGSFGLHRPHDRSNEGSGFGAVSPWADVDVQWVNTGRYDRFGLAEAVGASVPTGDDRSVWIGPFVRYEEFFQNQDPGKDARNSKTLVVGLSFEFGASVAPNPAPSVVVPPPANNDTVVVTKDTPTPPAQEPVMQTVVKHLRGKVQFDFDAALISADDQSDLAQLASGMVEAGLTDAAAAGNKIQKIEVSGYASNENHPRAEAHNQKLSEARAKAVGDFLVAHGVPASLLTVQGFGTSNPTADNSTEEGRRANRRTEFDITVSITVQGNAAEVAK